MDREPKTIEHNPNEKRQPWWLWWAVWAFLGALWLGQIGSEPQWHTVALAGWTGIMLACWAIDLNGVETPASWRRNSMRRR